MSDDLAHGPCAWGGTPAQLGRGHAPNQSLELLGGCRLNGKRSLAFHVAKNALRVLLCCFVHFILPSVTDHSTSWLNALARGVTFTSMFGRRFRVSTVILRINPFTLSGSS